MKKEFISVGKNMEKFDSYDKVTGKATYVADMHLPGMLHGKILHSTHAHALIKSIDVSKARALPGVHAVLTAADVPQIPYSGCGHPMPYDTPLDMRILTDHPRYVGDAIGAVAAATDDIAEEPLRLIEVEYEDLPFYTDPEAAMADDAYLIHEGHKNNICDQHGFEIGNVDEAFAKADIIVEDEFRVPIVTHCQIENHVSICDIDHRGRLTFYVSNQVPSIMRERLSKILGLRPRDVHIIKKTLGGGFGGKQEPVYEPINGCLTMATKRPVILDLSKEETLTTTRTRHSGIYRMRTGLMKDGTIIAREQLVIHNTGAYSSHGHNVLGNVSGQFGQVYPCPNLRWDGKTVYTNIPIGAAMRGYGIPQQAFVTECHTDNIAKRLGVDPLQFRLQHMRKLGDEPYGDNPNMSSALPEIIAWGRKQIGYDEFMKLPKQEGNIRRGIGMAIASYGQSCYPHSVELSSARITMHEDSSCTLSVGCCELGQGSNTAMAQIASEAMGVPFHMIEVNEGDTDIATFDVGAYASRQTYVAGTAVKKAGLKIKAIVLDRASEMLHRDADRLDTYNGYVVDAETLEQLIPIADVAYDCYYNRGKFADACMMIEANASHCPTTQALTYVCGFAEVEVDMETGYVNLKKVYTSCDCGTLINPLAAKSQLTGGSIMACGYGLTEQVLVDDKSGRVLNGNMLDYKVFTFADLPDLQAHFVESDEPSSAYGNKALGEPPMHTAAPAIRNAVLNATGIAINQNPLTPERVFLAIQAAKAKEAE